MNLKECYDAMDANYDDVMRRLGSEERITRFLSKILEDKSFLLLCNSMKAGNYEEAFRAAHSIKGICMNLGLTPLQESSSALTENLRDGKPDKDTVPLLERTMKDYEKIAAAIRTLLNG